MLARTGEPFWQGESYDIGFAMGRISTHWQIYRTNPVQAGLVECCGGLPLVQRLPRKTSRQECRKGATETLRHKATHKKKKRMAARTAIRQSFTLYLIKFARRK